MTPERWEQIREVLEKALELAPQQRSVFLEQACSSDTSLRREVDTLLASSDDVQSSFLQSAPLRLTLAAGTRLGDYEVKSLLGSGGMGEVYRALDLRLGRDVAIKVLPAFVAADPNRLRRFEQEARAAGALSHPNILAVHQMGEHEGAPFLVSELLEGETLREEIRRGRLATPKAIGYAVQIARGLAAAHEKGVVHRDLKPENLFVTQDGRVKILDFGLAKLTQATSDPGIRALRGETEPGVVMGTVGYMSPEQVRGQNTDQRTDIFSFGAILYEMLTGNRAFQKSTSADTLSAILNEDPPAVSETRGDTPAAMQAVVQRCLEKSAEKRFQSATELALALDGLANDLRDLPHELTGSFRHPGKFVRDHAGLTIGAMLILLLLAGTFLWRARRISVQTSDHPPSVPALKPRRSVAVLEIRNLSERPDEAWLETALSEMLTTELAAGEQLRTISGEDVARMKANLSLPKAGSYSQDTLVRIHKNIGVDEVVVGSYVPIGAGQIRVDLRLQDTNANERSEVLSAKGSTQRIDELVSRMGATLRRRLGVGEISSEEINALRAALPDKPATEELYAEGLRLVRLDEYQEARQVLEKAIAGEPDYPLAHSALAAAWSGMGQGDRARDEAKKAFDLSTHLPREKRLWIEAQFYSLTHDWAKAVQSYQTLFEFFPDNLDYGLRLASAQTASGHGKDSLATVELLRKLPYPDSDNPQIDRTEAVAAGSLGDFKRQHEAALRSAAKADAQGARLMGAQARISDCSALNDLGRPEEALATCEAAKRAFEEAGDHGGTARALNNMGVLLQEAGELTKAQKVYEDSLAATRLLGDRRAEGIVMNNIAEIQRAHGDLEGSLRTLDQTMKIDEEIGMQRGVEFVSFNTGIAHAAEGKLQEARKNYDVALKTSDTIGDKNVRATVLALIGDLYVTADDLPTARKYHEEALSIRRANGENRTVPESELALASLLVEEKQLPQGATAAQESASALQGVHAPEEAAVAFAVLARALREQGKIDDARTAVAHAAQLLQKDGDVTARLRVQLETVMVQAASGDAASIAAATKNLETSLNEISQRGLVGLQLEARLALGEIEIKANDPMAARTQLTRLERDAREKGFLLVADKALQILKNASSAHTAEHSPR
jgi:eukaryotic-like serine/threonine-protein kinase